MKLMKYIMHQKRSFYEGEHPQASMKLDPVEFPKPEMHEIRKTTMNIVRHRQKMVCNYP